MDKIKFILVNDRQARTEWYCALCTTPITGSWVREPQTRLLYCDPVCFKGHLRMAILAIEQKAKETS